MIKHFVALLILGTVMAGSLGLMMPVSVEPASAATGIGAINELLNNVAGPQGANFNITNVDKTTATLRIGQIIKFFLGFVGVVATLFIVYGGFVWITAGGSAEQVQKAQKFVINAALGLIVSSLAYIIVAVVIDIATKVPG